ncbi:soluble quino protein glucose dehydrogenase [Setomelanomma holmii]|uniref:Soluble quino protein glucose dehydrogenase n=1 Tax=Setomelanomma holmii TaxID=210430 RepID=A0A9P4H4E6_9PLEO|nr:soluble quino protein glucose dehydrogenase [Setomelanomma holmii]
MALLKFVLLVFGALSPSVLAQSCATINPVQTPSFASGYSGRVVINGLRTPRGIIFDNQGNLLITEQGGYGVRYVQLTDNGGTNVCVKSNKQLIAEDTINHGIALSPDGKKLYVSSQLYVWSWDYMAPQGLTLLVPKGRPDLLLVQRGSQDNIDTAAGQIETARSQIRVFKIADVEKSPVEYSTGEVLAWGIRNTVGVGEDSWGGIWSVDNGVDDMTRENKDIHNTNPCEELNFYGYINSNCTSVPTNSQTNHRYLEDPTVLPSPLNTQMKVGDTIAHGTANTASTCANCVSPKLCFPAHMAPLDIKFNANSTAAHIAFHGSWNRQPPDGFRVSRVEWDQATGMPVESVTSTTAVKNITFNANNADCPNGCFWPVGLTWDHKGRLFMASDSTNEVWIISGAEQTEGTNETM